MLVVNFRVVIACGSSDICGCVDWMLQLLVVEPGVDERLWTRSEAKERTLGVEEASVASSTGC